VRPDTDKGFALVSVLWAVAILSLVAAAMLSATLDSARMDDYTWNRMRAQAVADAGLQHAIRTLFDTRRDPDEAQDFSFGDAVAHLRIEDERGKIDINFAGRDLLNGLFKSAGVADKRAGALARRIVAWRMPQGNGRARTFQALDELMRIDGITPELFARIRPALTLYTHTPDVDMTTAPMEALEALPGFDADKAKQWIADRAKRPALGQTEAALAETVAPEMPYRGRIYSIHSEVRFASLRVGRSAVVLLTGDPLRPVWFLDWQ
jgi:general secretion pathway protein K